MSRPVTIRRATSADAAAFTDVFRNAVSVGAASVMTPDQIDAWTSVADDATAFGERMLQSKAWFAEVDGVPAGFTTLHDDGRVGMLYVRGDRQRLGIGGKLLQVAIDAAETAGCRRLYAEASVFSHPVFIRHGFRLTGTETVERAGESFKHYLVALDLGGNE